jgi:hypothetical protein
MGCTISEACIYSYLDDEQKLEYFCSPLYDEVRETTQTLSEN